MTDNQVKYLLILIPLFFVGIFVWDFAFIGTQKIKAAKVVTTDGREDYIENLSETYHKYIGITKKNNPETVAIFLKSCGLKGDYDWCAAFATQCHIEAGVKAIKSAWSPDWFPESNTIYTRGAKGNATPSRCDVLGLYYEDKGRLGHVGFIEEWSEGDYCVTVEGNIGGDGGGVFKKKRLKNQIYKVSRWI
jgi:hypothetical protein